MPYVRRTWQNAPSSATPLNAAALNNIETGIEEALAKPGATDAAVEAIIADTGSDTYATLNSTIGAVGAAQFAPLGELIAYDDFSRLPDGSLSGVMPLIGGVPWGTTGGGIPYISDGALVTDSSGYAYLNLPERADTLVAEVEFFAPTSTKRMTMAWVSGDTYDLTNLSNHFNFGTEGHTTTFKRGAVFPSLFNGSWAEPMVPGRRYVVTATIVGKRLVVTANGDMRVSPIDPRVDTLAGKSVFWEPGASGGEKVIVHRIAAFKHGEAEPFTLLSQISDFASIAASRGGNGEVRANAARMFEVAIGDPAGTGNPTIQFGATETRAQLTANMDIGATTYQSDHRSPAGTVVVVNPGMADEETFTTSGFPAGAAAPFTHTVTVAATKAHAAGAVLVGAQASNRRTTMYYNMGNGIFYMPPIATVFDNSTYWGTDLTTFIQRKQANRLGMGSGDSFQVDGTWNGGSFMLGTYVLWVDSTGDLRIKNGAPTSDTDGTVVGTQS